jgi:hypothetical protein
MRKRFSRWVAAIVTIALPAMVLIADAGAQWQRDGIAVCAAASADQGSEAICPDGTGGVILAWTDFRDGDWNIYAQRLDADGNRQWGAAGIPVCTNTEWQHSPEIVSDGAGGAVVVWRDQRFTNYPLFAQRLDALGGALWAANGVFVGSPSWRFPFQKLVNAGSSGFILAWIGLPGDSNSVYLQRLDADGNTLWGQPRGT